MVNMVGGEKSLNKKSLFILILLVSSSVFLILIASELTESRGDIYRDHTFPNLVCETENGFDPVAWSTIHYRFAKNGDVFCWDDYGNELDMHHPIFPNGITKVTLYEDANHIKIRYQRRIWNILTGVVPVDDVWFIYDFLRTDAYGFSTSEVRLLIRVDEYDTNRPLKIQLENPNEASPGDAYRATEWVDEVSIIAGNPHHKRQFWVRGVGGDGEQSTFGLVFDWSDVDQQFNPRVVADDNDLLLGVQAGDIIDSMTMGTATSEYSTVSWRDASRLSPPDGPYAEGMNIRTLKKSTENLLKSKSDGKVVTGGEKG